MVPVDTPLTPKPATAKAFANLLINRPKSAENEDGSLWGEQSGERRGARDRE